MFKKRPEPGRCYKGDSETRGESESADTDHSVSAEPDLEICG